MTALTPEDIDALLPQTQCGLCGHGGCLPYAEALLYQGEAIDRCPPGGVPTLKALATKLDIDPAPYMAEMEAKSKPPSVVTIIENECIGCTKCIQACPVDAIIGAAKLMHTVLTSECTGCELCIPACPVDCITILPIAEPISEEKQAHFRKRYQQRTQRLAKETLTKKEALREKNKKKLHSYISAAIARVNAKKTG